MTILSEGGSTLVVAVAVEAGCIHASSYEGGLPSSSICDWRCTADSEKAESLLVFSVKLMAMRPLSALSISSVMADTGVIRR